MSVGTKPNPTGVGQQDESVDLTDSAAEEEVSQGGHVPNPKICNVRWDYLGFFVVMHSLALLICVPWFFSLTGFLAFFFGVVIFGQLGIPICYHRLLTHRSFRTPKWLERTWVICALCQAQDTPAKWVAWHRMHHQHSDDEQDPHSPIVTFFWSHVGWLMHSTSGTHDISAYYKYARDIF